MEQSGAQEINLATNAGFEAPMGAIVESKSYGAAFQPHVVIMDQLRPFLPTSGLLKLILDSLLFSISIFHSIFLILFLLQEARERHFFEQSELSKSKHINIP